MSGIEDTYRTMGHGPAGWSTKTEMGADDIVVAHCFKLACGLLRRKPRAPFDFDGEREKLSYQHRLVEWALKEWGLLHVNTPDLIRYATLMGTEQVAPLKRTYANRPISRCNDISRDHVRAEGVNHA